MSLVRARVVLAVALVLEVALFAWLLHDDGAFAWVLHDRGLKQRDLWLAILATPVFAVAVWALSRAELTPRRAVPLILLVGALLQVLALTRAPLSSDDANRYGWDAKVQLAGIDPYRYPPSSPALRGLRERPLFGEPGDCSHKFSGGCAAINRVNVRTIYPPVAEGAFVLIRLASFGGHGNLLPFQIAAALGCLALAWLLCRATRARGRPVWLAAVWAWSPITVSEFGNNAHIDWLGALLALLGLLAFARGRSVVAGLLVGAAIATKLYPLLVLPSMLRRRPLLVLGTALGLVAASYVPHVVAVGTDVLGYLPGYLNEEGYQSGDRFLLVGAVLPHPLDTIAGVLLVAAVAAWAWRRTDPSRPELTAVVVVAVSLLVATPRFGWYSGLLVALIALSGALEWVPVALAPELVYLYRAEFPHDGLPSRLIYLVAAVLTAAGWWLRRSAERAHLGP